MELGLTTHDIEKALSFKFERITVGDKMVIEDFIELPVKDAEKIVKASYAKSLKGNNKLNSNYDTKGKVKTFRKRLFKKKK